MIAAKFSVHNTSATLSKYWWLSAELSCAEILMSYYRLALHERCHSHIFTSIIFFLSLSRFNDHFSYRPGFAGTRMSHFWILLELEVMEMVVTTGATRRAKHRHMMSMVQSSSQIVTTENQRPLFFTQEMPFLSSNQWCQSTEGNYLLLVWNC